MPHPADDEADDALSPAAAELERSLRRLRPTPPRASLQDVWHRAGYDAGRRSVGRWRAAAALLAVAAAGLAAYGVAVPRAERVVYVQLRPAVAPPAPQSVPAASPVVPVPTAPVPAAPLPGYAQLREAVASRGLDGLPPARAGTGVAAPGPAWPADLDDLFPAADSRRPTEPRG